MNKQDYDKYYQQGGSYVIPVEIFNELFEDYECFKNDCKKYKEVIGKIESLIKSKDNGTCIHNNERRGAYTFVLDFDEAREFVWNLEDILKEVK